MIRLLPISKYLKTASALLSNRLRGESRYPFYASFKLTSRCHFNCSFCNIRNDRQEDLSTEKVKRILDHLSASSVILVGFEGGEPLLRADIGELLEYARSKSFYLLFTTSERKLESYPMKEYAKYIDFFHISIDEGHRNLELYDRLPEFRNYGSQMAVQIVVTEETLQALESKVKRCQEVGANAVIMPAVHMNRTENRFPDLSRVEQEILRLKKVYPATIYTPNGYFDAVREGRCSTASVIINSDGRLYYPCHILENRGPDLAEQPLMPWLRSPEAALFRNQMKNCARRCGWYQYFSINDFVSLSSTYDSLKPFFSKFKIRHTGK